MYSTPEPSVPLGIAWAPYQWRVDADIPNIERAGQLCRLVGYRKESTASAVWFEVEFADGYRSEYFAGDLVAEPVWRSSERVR
jgi:hypothetical protein